MITALMVSGNLLWFASYISYMLGRIRQSDHFAAGAVSNALLFVVSVAIDSLFFKIVTGVLFVLCVICWWIDRRKGRGKRAVKTLGAKSKARIMALARQMTPPPRPVSLG